MLSMARSGQSTIRGGTNSGGETQPGIPVIQPLLIITTSPSYLSNAGTISANGGTGGTGSGTGGAGGNGGTGLVKIRSF
jgi:hypothetical protein